MSCLAPSGTFESSTLTGWKLSGASRVSGNESFLVNSRKDKYSLSLPAGASAQTPSFCVTAASPTIRFFIRNSGDPAATLKLEVLFTDPSAAHRRAPSRT